MVFVVPHGLVTDQVEDEHALYGGEDDKRFSFATEGHFVNALKGNLVFVILAEKDLFLYKFHQILLNLR